MKGYPSPFAYCLLFIILIVYLVITPFVVDKTVGSQRALMKLASTLSRRTQR